MAKQLLPTKIMNKAKIVATILAPVMQMVTSLQPQRAAARAKRVPRDTESDGIVANRGTRVGRAFTSTIHPKGRDHWEHPREAKEKVEKERAKVQKAKARMEKGIGERATVTTTTTTTIDPQVKASEKVSTNSMTIGTVRGEMKDGEVVDMINVAAKSIGTITGYCW